MTNLMDNMLEKLHIEQLSPMQTATAAALLNSENDVVVLSPTGSGKTLAYLLPLLHLIDPSRDEVQAVVVVPGRELALQSYNVFKTVTNTLKACACYGGRPAMDEHKLLRQVCPQVVFATPGRLNDHLDKGNIAPDSIGIIVIDEFDKCLEMGFQDEMSALISKLPALDRRVLLSATDAEAIPRFVNMQRVERVDYRQSQDSQQEERLRIAMLRSPDKDKLTTLSLLLRSYGDQSTIVFLNHREAVERTAAYLKDQGFSVTAFHGGLDQKAREDALYRFSNGSANVCVSTDLASRGLDIPEVEHIIHYHLPETQTAYTHRVGRTARWQAEGDACFLLGPTEQLPEYVDSNIPDVILPEQLPAPSQPRMTTIYVGKGKKDKLSRGDILGFICKKGGIDKSKVGRIDVKERYSYIAVQRDVARQVLRQVQGEKIKGLKTVFEEIR